MPMYEYICPSHGKFEMLSKMGQRKALCTTHISELEAPDGKGGVCGEVCDRVEFSVPAKRDPRYGEG